MILLSILLAVILLPSGLLIGLLLAGRLLAWLIKTLCDLGNDANG